MQGINAAEMAKPTFSVALYARYCYTVLAMRIKDRFLFNKRFLLGAIAIILPIALQNVINYGVNLMDSVMLGQLGDVAISAANLGGQPFFLLTMFGFGIASGANVMIAQYWGKGDMEHIRRIMGFAVRLAFFVSLAFTVLCIAVPEGIISLFTSNPDTIRQGADYLWIISIGYVFYSLSNCYMTSLRAVERVGVSMVVYGISFFVNVAVNYVFIFGKLGAPALGVKGAAIGTVVARVSEFIMALIYMYAFDKRTGFRIKDVFTKSGDIVKPFMKNCLPVIGNELLWGFGSVMITLIISNISDDFIAAGSIANVVNQIAIVGIMGVSNAAAVLTGKTVGEGDKEKVQKVADTMLLFSVAVGIFGSVLLFALRVPILAIYDISDSAKQITSQLIIILAALQTVLAVDITCIVGVLRGGGDTRFAFAIDVGTVYLIALPLGAIAGYVLGWPAWAVYLLLRCDTFVKAVLGLVRVARRKWQRDVTVGAAEKAEEVQDA